MRIRMIHLALSALTASLYVLVDTPVSVLTRRRLDAEDPAPVEW